MTDTKLNDNEIKALEAICATCDDIEGEGFTRIFEMCEAVSEIFDRNYQRAGGYIRSLMDKGVISVEVSEDEVWVDSDVFVAHRGY